MKIQVTNFYKEPVEEVFDAIVENLRNLKDSKGIITSVIKVEVGNMGPGTEIEITQNVGLKKIQVSNIIKINEPPKRLVVEGSQSNWKTVATTTFISRDNCTEVINDHELVITSRWAPLIKTFSSGFAVQSLIKSYERMDLDLIEYKKLTKIRPAQYSGRVFGLNYIAVCVAQWLLLVVLAVVFFQVTGV